MSAALCTQSDLDFYKFAVTKAGAISVKITTGDTPVRVTLTGTGIAATQDIAANTTSTITANAATIPNAVTLKVEAFSAVGAEPSYTFIPTFGQVTGPRQRTVRKRVHRVSIADPSTEPNRARRNQTHSARANETRHTHNRKRLSHAAE